MPSKINFSAALMYAKQGCKITRESWVNIKFAVVMPELKLPAFSTQNTNVKVNDRTAKYIGVDTPLDSQRYFACFTANDKWQPGWTPSIADIFAEDWTVIRE